MNHEYDNRLPVREPGTFRQIPGRHPVPGFEPRGAEALFCDNRIFPVPRRKRLTAEFRTRFGTPLYPIGRITSEAGLTWLRNGRPEPHDWQGFSHY